MTLREHLFSVFSTGGVFRVISTLEQVYYKANELTTHEIGTKYTQVAQELLELPGLPGCNDHSIQLSPVVEEDEEYIDVHLKSQSSDEVYSISYVDWCDIIDSPVITDQSLDITNTVAHILWEITFHGWTRREILLASQKLKQVLDEAEQGNTIPYEEFKKQLSDNSCDTETRE